MSTVEKKLGYKDININIMYVAQYKYYNIVMEDWNVQ